MALFSRRNNVPLVLAGLVWSLFTPASLAQGAAFQSLDRCGPYQGL